MDARGLLAPDQKSRWNRASRVLPRIRWRGQPRSTHCHPGLAHRRREYTRRGSGTSGPTCDSVRCSAPENCNLPEKQKLTKLVSRWAPFSCDSKDAARRQRLCPGVRVARKPCGITKNGSAFPVATSSFQERARCSGVSSGSFWRSGSGLKVRINSSVGAHCKWFTSTP